MRTGCADRFAPQLDRQTARCVALVRVALTGQVLGVDGFQHDPFVIYLQLGRRDVSQCGVDSLTKLDLAGEDGDRVRIIDTDPRIEAWIVDCGLGQTRLG